MTVRDSQSCSLDLGSAGPLSGVGIALVSARTSHKIFQPRAIKHRSNRMIMSNPMAISQDSMVEPRIVCISSSREVSTRSDAMLLLCTIILGWKILREVRALTRAMPMAGRGPPEPRFREQDCESRTVMCQSPATYKWWWNKPEFRALAPRDHGCWTY